ncbi:TolC family outer membrane protein [Pseudomonas sp. NFR16]|uniref:TolC family outer membrane protein n=1 Tax=Pseudomonas sp. NFR16 TaxID=1566248 RepID=UPI0008AF87D8|nr:TolC family outer membrane protein [Pseudomonas sp. NFR16]SEJ95032.1 outer membrane protein [Pseudomonas sp. NFR16]
MLRNSPMPLAVLCVVGLGIGVTGNVSASQANLVSVYSEALQNDPYLAAARAEYEARREVVPQAKANLLPNLSAGATVGDTRTAFDQPSVTSNRSGNAYQATLIQPVFHMDRWFQLSAAEAVNDQAMAQLAVVQQDLVMRSAQDYFEVLRAQDSLAATKAEEAAFKYQLDQASARFATGLADKTDTLQAQASYDTSRANRIVAERQVDDAFQALNTLTDHEYRSLQGVMHELPLVPPSPASASDWVDAAAKQNLDLRVSNYAVDSAHETVKQRKAGHAPTVDIVARFQKGDNDSLGFTNPSKTGARYSGDVEQRTISLQLNVPIYSGGLINSQVAEAVARLDESEHQREGVRRRVVESARNFYRAVITDVEQAKARNQSIISNQNAVQATEVGYRVGTRNIVDVLDAQRQLFTAVRDYNNSRYNYLLDILELKRAAGTLSPDDLQALQSYFKPDYDPDKDFLPPEISHGAGKAIALNGIR